MVIAMIVDICKWLNCFHILFGMFLIYCKERFNVMDLGLLARSTDIRISKK
jgi:hypothetical protein